MGAFWLLCLVFVVIYAGREAEYGDDEEDEVL